MILERFKDKKLLRKNDKIEILKDYLFKLKRNDLNSTNPLSPEIEDLIKIHLSNISFGETQSLINEFIFPGIQILSNNPNALIGDAISLVISLESFKNILFSDENSIDQFTKLFTFKDWEKLSQRAIFVRISILITLTKSKVLFNKLIPYLKDFILLIFNNFDQKSYFIYKSVSDLFSVIIKMDALNSFIFENFFGFQNNLYTRILSDSDSAKFSLIQMYKLLINNGNMRKLLFKNNNFNINGANLCNIIDKATQYNFFSKNDLFSFLLNKLLPLILNNTDNFISNTGLEILDILLSDIEISDSHLIVNLVNKHLKRVNNLMKFFSKKVVNNNGLLKAFILDLNIINLIIDNNKLYNVFLNNLACNLLKFTTMLISSHSDYSSSKKFIESGLFKTLLRTISRFTQLSNDFNNSISLSDYELNRINMLNSELLETIKAILINLDCFKNTFQITEPEILNYALLTLKSVLICASKYLTSYEHLVLFTEELVNIYDEPCLSIWKLCFIIKYLTVIFSTNNIYWISERVYDKTAAIIENSIFYCFIDKDGKTETKIRNYVVTDPNIVLFSSELLGKLINGNSLNERLFEKLFILSGKFIKECLKHRPLKNFTSKTNVFHDKYDFFISFIPQLNIKFKSR
ncbi:hypothetical protein FG386_002038 [Cryptosporidium ryanae]|uniref:uncharacterized protein n=1 Tax=Cryptosporidium ryanae TaxID=515981 RepID=UPI00351A01BB|nr:hypothetical protein FG386_002038 [Cryptosporidium ryanae]